MDLLQHLRSERAEKRRKQSLAPTLFDRINGLVKAHALDDTFLRSLEASAGPRREEDLRFDRVKPKPAYKPPLFSLSTQEEYRVTMAIINSAGNAYLDFVNSRDEILLCRLLFRHNSTLPPERLAAFHFEVLLLIEVARKEIGGLTEQVQHLLSCQKPGRPDPSEVSSLQGRIEDLHAFVARMAAVGVC